MHACFKGKQEVAVEFVRYHTKLRLYIASAERRYVYGSTGFMHVITECSIL